MYYRDEGLLLGQTLARLFLVVSQQPCCVDLLNLIHQLKEIDVQDSSR
jgi:hypothetical protein